LLAGLSTGFLSDALAFFVSPSLGRGPLRSFLRGIDPGHHELAVRHSAVLLLLLLNGSSRRCLLDNK
jgi:hypothetical protein